MSELCDKHEYPLHDHCFFCGAPVCCRHCCHEATLEQTINTQASRISTLKVELATDKSALKLTLDRISALETPKGALEVLSKAMQSDYDYAWSWHCNVAVAAIDAGAPHKEANERAADFMFRAFGVRTDHLPPPPTESGQ